MTEIDVSGCKYYNSGTYEEEPYCGIDEEHPYTCISDENCYYKQLKRLEQENAKLKEALKEIREMAIYDCERECSNNSENCTIGSCLEKRIQRKINKVLGAEE